MRLLLLLLLCNTALAGEGTYLKYMINADTSNIAKVKALALGHQSEFAFLETKWELGGIADQRDGAEFMGYGNLGLGIEPTAGAFFVNFFQGVGLLTRTDAYLGGHFQFFEEFGLGIRDQKTKTSLGFFYQHISSAGLALPNKGKDLFGIKVQIPW